MPSYTSSNTTPVDSPFSKLLANKAYLGFIPGIPPISNSNTYSQELYTNAAAVLGLDSDDPEYLAKRVRHLAHVIRHSRFANKATWRSALPAIDALIPIVDDPSGLLNITKSATISYQLVKTGTPNPKKLLWRLAVAGTYPDLTATLDGVPVASFSADSGLIALADSGHSIKYTCTAGSGSTVTFNADLWMPYVGDCYPVYAAIKQSYDLVNQIAYNKPDYMNAIFVDNIVEDAIAAFILAVDEA